jgi:hypothetical protein
VKILSLENLVALNHITEDHTLLRKSSHTHTHALHELSKLFKKFSAGNFFLLANYITLCYILALVLKCY